MSDAPNTTALVKSPMAAGAALRSINPTTFEEVTRLAKVAVLAGLTASKDDNEDKAIAKATMAILQGLELGIPAMQAVQGIAIINGKAMIYGDLLTAVLWSKGFKVEKRIEGSGHIRCGYAKITRPDGIVIEKRFSVEDAKRARLWDEREIVKRRGKNGEWYESPNDSPWHRFPDRMLEWRAFGFCCKDGASDVTRGMYVREEMAPEYNEMVDITPAREPLPDIPDIPDGTEANTCDAEADQRYSDQDYLKSLDECLAAASSIATLQEVMDANAEEISDRGLQQEAANLYEGHRSRMVAAMARPMETAWKDVGIARSVDIEVEPVTETVAETGKPSETIDIPWDDEPDHENKLRKTNVFKRQLEMAPNATRLKDVFRSWNAYMEGLSKPEQAQFQAEYARALQNLKQRATV